MSDGPNNRAGGTQQGNTNQGANRQANQQANQQAARGQGGNAQRRGAQGGQGQAYGQQQRRGGTSVLSKPVPKRYLQFIIGTMAGSGLILGVMLFLLKAIGGLTIIPSTVKQLQSTSGVASAGISLALDWANGLALTYLTAELAPFIAFAMTLALVAVVVSRMNETRKNKVTVAALGVFVGAFLFVALSTFIASIVGPTLPTGATGIGTGGLTQPTTGAAGMSQSINFGPLLLDSLIIGVGCSLLASLTAYLGSSLPN